MTTNIEIEGKLKKIKKFKGCLMRDEVSKKMKAGYYIMNMDDSTGDGTHWTGLYVGRNKAYYFDPFGVVPPESLKKLKSKSRKVYYNSNQLQDINTDTCGQWCMLFVKYMNKNNNDFESFLEFDTFDTIRNEKLLQHNI